MRAASSLKALCAAQAVLSFGQGLAFPFLALYLHRDRGLPMAWVGAWLSLGVLATAAGQGFGGELSDRLGRARVMRSALWSRAAAVLAMAWVIGARGPLTLLLLLHLVSGFTSHLFEPAARGWIADHSSERQRHRAYAWLRMATHGGFAAGPALGGLLAERSFTLIFGLTGVVCLLCAAAAGLLGDDGRTAAEDRFEPAAALRPARDTRFLRLCLLNALLAVATAQLVGPLSVYASRFLGLRDAQIGLLLSLNGLMTVLLQVPVVHALGGAPLSRALALGAACYAAGWAAVGAAEGLAGLAAAVAAVTLGELLVPAASVALAANMAPERERGRYLGFLGLCRQLGSALGPAAGLAGLELWGAGHWEAVAVLALAAGAGFFWLGRGLKPSEQGTHDDNALLEAR